MPGVRGIRAPRFRAEDRPEKGAVLGIPDLVPLLAAALAVPGQDAPDTTASSDLDAPGKAGDPGLDMGDSADPDSGRPAVLGGLGQGRAGCLGDLGSGSRADTEDLGQVDLAPTADSGLVGLVPKANPDLGRPA